MTVKERVLAALDHEEADRAPLTNRFAPEVAGELRDRIAVFGKQGGFIINPFHNVQPHPRSVDNTLAYYWACRNIGGYGRSRKRI